MDRRHHVRGEWRRDEFPALAAEAKWFPEERLRGGRTHTDQDDWFDDLDFGVQPGAAGGDFARVRFFVDAPFSGRFPFEMLDDVGDIDLLPIDADFLQNVIE